jgi:hypothetical protein
MTEAPSLREAKSACGPSIDPKTIPVPDTGYEKQLSH